MSVPFLPRARVVSPANFAFFKLSPHLPPAAPVQYNAQQPAATPTPSAGPVPPTYYSPSPSRSPLPTPPGYNKSPMPTPPGYNKSPMPSPRPSPVPYYSPVLPAYLPSPMPYYSPSPRAIPITAFAPGELLPPTPSAAVAGMACLYWLSCLAGRARAAPLRQLKSALLAPKCPQARQGGAGFLSSHSACLPACLQAQSPLLPAGRPPLHPHPRPRLAPSAASLCAQVRHQLTS